MFFKKLFCNDIFVFLGWGVFVFWVVLKQKNLLIPYTIIINDKNMSTPNQTKISVRAEETDPNSAQNGLRGVATSEMSVVAFLMSDAEDKYKELYGGCLDIGDVHIYVMPFENIKRGQAYFITFAEVQGDFAFKIFHHLKYHTLTFTHEYHASWDEEDFGKVWKLRHSWFCDNGKCPLLQH